MTDRALQPARPRPRIVRIRLLPTVVDFLPEPPPAPPAPAWEPVLLQRPIRVRVLAPDEAYRAYRAPAYDDGADDDDDAPDTGPRRYWTPERIFFAVIIAITLLAFLATSFSGLFMPGPPPPPAPVAPMSLV